MNAHGTENVFGYSARCGTIEGHAAALHDVEGTAFDFVERLFQGVDDDANGVDLFERRRDDLRVRRFVVDDQNFQRLFRRRERRASFA